MKRRGAVRAFVHTFYTQDRLRNAIGGGLIRRAGVADDSVCSRLF
jgi:hypothetical protein